MAIITSRSLSNKSIPILDLRGKKVLIVDDFLNFRLNVRNMISFFRPKDLDEAANGEDAVSKISQNGYDIILCDYNLGAGKDGQQVLEESKFNNYITNATIFMMVTAENTIEMLLGALEYEPDDYLMKPFTRDTLEKKIRGLITKKEVRKDVDQAIMDGEYENALRLCNELIDNNIKHLAELLRLKGEIIIKLGNYEQAASFYREVINMGRFPWAVFGLGKANYLSENYDEALRIFSDLIKSNNKFMPAYDWLAKTLQKINKNREAQQVLINAISVSPKAILRQKELGDLAYRNEDLVTAEKTFKTVVKQGKNSCFKTPADYTKLAKVLTDRDAGEEGLLVLKDANKEFVNDPKAAVQVALTESLVYKKMNRVEDAKKATDKVMSILNSESDKTSADFELDMARALFIQGHGNEAREIIRRVIQSNHQEDDVLENIQMLFKDLELEDEGQKMIGEAVEEVVVLNNEGVRLVKEGELVKAIDYFRNAAKRLDQNKVINANAANSMIVFMNKNGVRREYLEEVKTYLDRVRGIDPEYRDLPALLLLYKQLLKGTLR